MSTFPVKFQPRSLNPSGSLALPRSTKQSVLRGHHGCAPKESQTQEEPIHSFCSYLSHSQSPYHRQNHTGHLDHQRLETRKMQSLSKHAGHMPESQGLKKSRTAAENTHSSTICTTNAGQQPGLLFHTPLGDLVLISLRGPEGGGSTLPYDCASALSPTQLYLGDNH